MLVTSRLRGLAAWLFIAVVLAPVARSQGASKGDGQAVRAALGAALGDASLAERPPSVDLRPLMPRVGRQSMNDCAAWAFGYYARSYVEARNQGWRPSEPSRVFSPSFIYNQVNGGKDEGSNPVRVLELLRDRGAATLSTFPYAARDFHKQPPVDANREAPAFQIDSYGWVTNGEQMRWLLARGEVVVLGVRTNPVFSGGRYSIYDSGAHERGRALREPGQPHGYHAMAVAGYDDARQAFLVMNSWGSDWGEDGAVWVHYDVSEQFNLSESTEQLIDYGLVMFDSRVVLEREDGIWKPFDISGLQVDLRSRFMGVDTEGERRFHHYFELTGGGMRSNLFEEARWEMIADGEVIADGVLTGGFGRGPSGSHTSSALAGVVRLSYRTFDGREGQIDEAFQFDVESLRDVRLTQHDAYFGERLDGSGHAWRWSMVPRMSARDWADLESITWLLLKEDGTAERRASYEHDGSTAPSFERSSKAIFSGVAAAARSGSADLRFKDGGSVRVAFPEEPFGSPVLQGATIVVDKRAEGRFHGQAWHHFDARVVFPESWRGLVDSARFMIAGLRLDGGISVFGGEPSRWPAASSFAMSGYAAETLDVDVDLRLRFSFDVDLDFVDLDQLFTKRGDGWETWVEKRAESSILDLGTPDVTFSWSDRYIGLVDGKPTWEVTQFLADRSSHSYGLPTYDWPDAVTHQKTLRSRNVFCEQGEVVHTSGPYEVVVQREDYEAQGEVVVTHRANVSPRSPRTTAISLDARRGTPDLLTPAPDCDPVSMVTIDVRGPLQRLDRSRSLTAYVPSLAGGFQEANAVRPCADTDDRDELLRARVPAPAEGEPVRIRIGFIDGSSMLTEAMPRGFTPYPLSVPIQLEAVERPWAIEDGLPQWLVDVELTGHVERLDEVEAVRLTSVDERGRRCEIDVDSTTWSAEVITSVPLRFEARVEFDDACGRAPETFAAHATLVSRHTPEPLELFTILVDEDEVYVDPNAWDIHAGAEEPTSYAVTALRGWERDLRRVRAVRHRIVDQEAQEYVEDYTPEVRKVVSRDAERVGAFGTPYSFMYPAFEMSAVVTLEGATEPVSVAGFEVSNDTFFAYEPGARSRIARFGTNESGDPTWILRCDSQRHTYARIANHLRYNVAGAPAFPLDVLEPDAAPWATTGPNEAGFFRITSQTYPGYPAEALVTTAPTRGFAGSEAYGTYGWREIPALEPTGIKFDEERMATLPADPGPNELTLTVGPAEGAIEGELTAIGLSGPLELSATAVGAHYTVDHGTESIEIEPFALHGFGHERFAVRLEGGLPDAVRCELLGAGGESLRTIEWAR